MKSECTIKSAAEDVEVRLMCEVCQIINREILRLTDNLPVYAQLRSTSPSRSVKVDAEVIVFFFISTVRLGVYTYLPT